MIIYQNEPLNFKDQAANQVGFELNSIDSDLKEQILEELNYQKKW